MKKGFLKETSLSSLGLGGSPYPAPLSLEQRISILEEKVEELTRLLKKNNQEEMNLEYRRAINELIKGNKQPIDKFIKKYGKIPEEVL